MRPTAVRPFTLGVQILTYGSSWADALATVRLADRLGYDQVFAADHLYATGGDPFQPFFEGWTALAAWAQATEHVELGLLVGANTFRNPGIVAKMAVTLDHISGGRAILGLGAAWEETEQRAHGIDPGRGLGQRIDWLDEALEIIRALLDGRTVTHHSERYQFDAVRHAPLPVRRPMPVMVGASGERKGLRIVARHGSLWHVWGPLDDMSEFVRLRSVLGRHCDDVGRDTAEIAPIVGAKVVIRDTPDAALRAFEHQVTIQPWRGEVLAGIRRNVWATTPAGVADALERYRAAGAEGFIAQVYEPYDHETIEALAAIVRDRFADQPAPAGEGTAA